MRRLCGNSKELLFEASQFENCSQGVVVSLFPHVGMRLTPLRSSTRHCVGCCTAMHVNGKKARCTSPKGGNSDAYIVKHGCNSFELYWTPGFEPQARLTQASKWTHRVKGFSACSNIEHLKLGHSRFWIMWTFERCQYVHRSEDDLDWPRGCDAPCIGSHALFLRSATTYGVSQCSSMRHVTSLPSLR